MVILAEPEWRSSLLLCALKKTVNVRIVKVAPRACHVDQAIENAVLVSWSKLARNLTIIDMRKGRRSSACDQLQPPLPGSCCLVNINSSKKRGRNHERQDETSKAMFVSSRNSKSEDLGYSSQYRPSLHLQEYMSSVQSVDGCLSC